MLKSRITILVVLLALVGGFATAQQAADLIDNPSELFVRTIIADTVYTHTLGYKVTFTDDTYTRREVFLPQPWFTEAAGRGQLVSTQSAAAPYLDVFYENGEFSHVRLFVPTDRNDLSWEVLREEGVDEDFNVDTFAIR